MLPLPDFNMPAVPPAGPAVAAYQLAISGAVTGPAVLSAAAPRDERPQFRAAEVTVNGERVGHWLLMELGGSLHATRDAISSWRLVQRPDMPRITMKGEDWYVLNGLPGFESRFDAAAQAFDLRFAPAAFMPTQVKQGVGPQQPIAEAIPFAYLNYDLSFNAERNTSASNGNGTDMGALMELGYSDRYGSISTVYVGRDLFGQPVWRRLDTKATHDFPEHGLSLSAGDLTTRNAFGGRSIYFGGLQIGTRFGMGESLPTQPIPSAAGTATVPSVVELYVNDLLRERTRVPAGPFALDNLPLINGSGVARIVVRDALGREVVTEQDFFSHASLLRQGLSDWSYAIGAARFGQGVANADYRQRFNAGMYRYGVSDATTLDVSAEASAQTRGYTLGVSRNLFNQVLGQFAAGQSSDSTLGRGTKVTAALEYTSTVHAASAQIQRASTNYTMVGEGAAVPNASMRQGVSYRFAHPQYGHWGVALAKVDMASQAPLRIATLSYAHRVGTQGLVVANLVRSNGVNAGTTLNIGYSTVLGNGVASATDVSFQRGRTDVLSSASEAANGEVGARYRVQGGTQQGLALANGGFYDQGARGILSVEGHATAQDQQARIGYAGGIGVTQGRPFASRQIEGSFGVVEVPGHADVGVGLQGRVQTTTDAQGIAILPGLLPYAANNIWLAPATLPISADIENIEKVVKPAARSAVKVTFPIRSGRNALISLVLDDGLPAPAGAEVELIGDREPFFVARRGEAFVTGLAEHSEIRVRHRGQACTVVVALPPSTADEIARVGPLVCSGVTR